LETIKSLEGYKHLKAVEFLKDNFNKIPMYFFYAYVLSLEWITFEANEFPDYLYEYVPELINSEFNLYLKEFYEKINIEKVWESQKVQWEETLFDCGKCFEGVYFKDLLSKFFGEINYDLIFYPNILVPQLMSSGASSSNKLYCIARMPGPVKPTEQLMKFSDDVNWVNIVAFHEFCHPLLDYVFRNNKEEVLKSKIIANKINILDEYKKNYPQWDELFSELLIYSMTIVFLRHYISKDAADTFATESEQKTGITLYKQIADILEEYLLEFNTNKYENISDYFSTLISKLKV